MEPLALELRTFIVNNFLFGEASGRFTFSDDDSFQERGIVDSTGILELVCHLLVPQRLVVHQHVLHSLHALGRTTHA